MRTRSFASRLAALEQLDQQAAQEAEDGPPNVALLADDDVAFWATMAMRSHNLQVELSAPLGRVVLARRTWGRSDVWHRFYTDLAPRATALLDALPKPIVFLARWEVMDAIAAIDAGACYLTWSEHMRGGMMVRQFYRLWATAQGTPLLDDEDARQAQIDTMTTCQAVSRAHDLVQRQLHYPQPRDFSTPEMTALDEWRDWLVSIGG